MKRPYITVSGLIILIATGASAQDEITEITGRFYRELERRHVTIGAGSVEQIGVNCDGGRILSASGFSLQDGTDGRFGYENLDLSNIHITTVSSAYISHILQVSR